MRNYVYLGNKKFFQNSRVSYIKMVIVLVLRWWDYGYILSLFYKSFVILFILMKKGYSNNTSTSLFCTGFSEIYKG